MTPNQDPDILWNFEKFLVARDGTVVRRFAPAMTPDDPDHPRSDRRAARPLYHALSAVVRDHSAADSQ